MNYNSANLKYLCFNVLVLSKMTNLQEEPVLQVPPLTPHFQNSWSQLILRQNKLSQSTKKETNIFESSFSINEICFVVKRTKKKNMIRSRLVGTIRYMCSIGFFDILVKTHVR